MESGSMTLDNRAIELFEQDRNMKIMQYFREGNLFWLQKHYAGRALNSYSLYEGMHLYGYIESDNPFGYSRIGSNKSSLNYHTFQYPNYYGAEARRISDKPGLLKAAQKILVDASQIGLNYISKIEIV